MFPVYRPGRPLRYNRSISTPVITFDAGQTLVELDLDFLVRRLRERGVEVAPGALVGALPAAWRRYDELTDAGAGHPWHALMTSILGGAGVAADEVAPLVDWLWDEQPRANLWRRPIPGMIALARELRDAGARIAVLSNSEGKLAELLAEVGIAELFEVIIDSGRLGFAKPDPRIFHATLAALGALGVPDVVADVVPIHIGDLWSADIAGALAVGWRAIWYGRRATLVDDPRVAVAHDPVEARAALVRWGALRG